VYAASGKPFASLHSPSEVRPKVISAIRKALELDPALPEAHAPMGDLYQMQWLWSDAEREYKLALELNPNDAGGRTSHLRVRCCFRDVRRRRWRGPDVPENLNLSVLRVPPLGGSYSRHATTMKPFANCEATCHCAGMMAHLIGLAGSWDTR
jgi:tetratricopeptide (TPR) repeat protein